MYIYICTYIYLNIYTHTYMYECLYTFSIHNDVHDSGANFIQ